MFYFSLSKSKTKEEIQGILPVTGVPASSGGMLVEGFGLAVVVMLLGSESSMVAIGDLKDQRMQQGVLIVGLDKAWCNVLSRGSDQLLYMRVGASLAVPIYYRGEHALGAFGVMVVRTIVCGLDQIKEPQLTAPIAAMVVDLFGSDAFDVAKEFNVPSYIFLPSLAMLLSLYLHLPKLNETYSCEYRDLYELVKLTGCTTTILILCATSWKRFDGPNPRLTE
ncbi:hypothetical protein NE237_013248 [Protea cynaroides]|uniref:Uncharacterized protein n=1 Tax=Protea cynaroides TaxID=273540 RepID=A0A9Q0JZM1_9MAGN|nr:hypothetical protein NE237_013248 [Protea cynaroides]